MDLTRRAMLIATVGSVAVAGCLGDDGDDENGDGNGNGADDTDDGGEEMATTVQVRTHPEFGDILVGPDDMTLYNFDADTQGEPESACYDDCADNWPPLTVDGSPSAGEDVTASLSTFERDDGSTQVAADGWPLYYFAADGEPGDANGQGVDDAWWVLEPDGSPIRDGEDVDDDDDDGDNDDDDDGDDDVPGY